MNTFRDSLKASRYTGTSMGRNVLVTSVAWISAGLYLATVLFMVICDDKDDKTAKQFARGFLILWAVVPPAWFWIEHHLIWQTAIPAERGDFQHFKHSQELSRNIWLAFVALLAALYFK